jgi:hypothetical protein
MMIYGEIVHLKVGHKSRPKSFLALESLCLWFDKGKGLAFLCIIYQMYYKSSCFHKGPAILYILT